MSGFIEGKSTKELAPLKRFGYIFSAALIIFSTISMMNNWIITPWLVLLTLYFLTGSLWIPVLIKPFYLLARRPGKKKKDESKEDDKYFNPN